MPRMVTAFVNTLGVTIVHSPDNQIQRTINKSEILLKLAVKRPKTLGLHDVCGNVDKTLYQ